MTYHDLYARVLETPHRESWTYENGQPGSFHESPRLDVGDVDDKWKVLCCIIAYNIIDMLPRYDTLERVLHIAKPELREIIRQLKKENRVVVMPTYSMETGLISGSGFYAEK